MISKSTILVFCSGDFTKIENYDKAIADNTQTWVIHHRAETHFSNGTQKPVSAYLTKAELVALDMYYDRPPEELIFMTRSDHNSLHHKNHVMSEEAKIKLAESHRGKKASLEAKQNMSKSRKGKYWYNNGIKSTLAYKCPEGFTPGRLPFSCSGPKGQHWYNNGEKSIVALECPEGFVRGRLCPEKLFGKPSSNRD